MTGKWLNRAVVITLLICVYAAGYDTGRDQVIQSQQCYESR